MDAADFTVWRDCLGDTASLPNDDTPGVGQDDYDRWKSHFVQAAAGIAGQAAGRLAKVPEPNGLALTVFALMSSPSRDSRRRSLQA